MMFDNIQLTESEGKIWNIWEGWNSSFRKRSPGMNGITSFPRNVPKNTTQKGVAIKTIFELRAETRTECPTFLV